MNNINTNLIISEKEFEEVWNIAKEKIIKMAKECIELLKSKNKMPRIEEKELKRRIYQTFQEVYVRGGDYGLRFIEDVLFAKHNRSEYYEKSLDKIMDKELK